MLKSALLLIFTAFSLTVSAQIQRDDFDTSALDANWNFVRSLDSSRWTLTERPNFLRLKGSTVTLDDTEAGPVFIGKKQLRADFEAITQIDFQPKQFNEVAGITLRQDERHHYEFGIRKSEKGRELFLRYALGSIRPIVLTQAIADGPIKLKVRGFPKYYRFSYALGNGEFTEIGGVETKYLEAADGLNSILVGPFASGNGRESSSNADFDWFEYNASPKDPFADIAINDPNLPKGYTIFSVDTAEKGIIAKYPFITRPSSIVPAEIEAHKDLIYAEYGDRKMRLDLFKPKVRKGLLPAIIIVHGGAWITGNHVMENPLAIALAKRGFIAATVEYRLSNESKYPAQIYDLKASVRWLRANAAKFGIDAKRIAAIGASSGGHLVALLGATNELSNFEGTGGHQKFSSRVQSVVDIDGTATFIDPGNVEKEIKGPYDTNTRLTGFTYAQNPEIWREASPITHVNKKSSPILFLNSSSYRPYQQREEMSAKLNSLGITSEIVVIPDTPHPFWLFHPWFDATVLNVESFLRKTLK